MRTFRKMNDREKEVYLAVADILDVTEKPTQFTELLKIILEGY